MIGPRPGRTLTLALSAALLLCPLAARAEPTAEERAAARALFDEGRALMAEKRYPEACPKLEEAFRIDPGIGTQYNLGDCQEHLGKLASAWANFSDAASRARAAGQEDRAQVAKDRAAALAPRLTKLVIVASDPKGEIAVTRDGVAVNKAMWGTAVPLDPGDHLVSATGPGKKPWQTTITIRGEGTTSTITIPALVDLPPQPPALGPKAGAPLAPSPPPDKGLGRQRIAAIAVGSVGVVGLAAGTALGILAKSKYDASLDHCPDPMKPNVCTQAGKDLRDAALGLGTGGTVAFVMGGVALAGGVALWLTAPRRGAPAKGVGVQADLGAGRVGLSVRGGF